jgi:NADH:ubiquinone oxidoreductase subunit B-like Fe-S oxidoreductase
MIDFTTSQLTWIVVGACSLGGGGYLTMTSTVADLDKKLEVSNARSEAMNEKLSSLQTQLDRIEHKIDSGRK